MAIHIHDPEVDQLVRELARRQGVDLTEAVRLAARRALETPSAPPDPSWQTGATRPEAAEAMREARLRTLYARWDAMPKSGLEADKAFFDSLYEDD